MTTLAGCPFCGEPCEKIGDSVYARHAPDCYMTTNHGTLHRIYDGYIEAWQTRTSSQAERVQKLEEEVGNLIEILDDVCKERDELAKGIK